MYNSTCASTKASPVSEKKKNSAENLLHKLNDVELPTDNQPNQSDRTKLLLNKLTNHTTQNVVQPITRRCCNLVKMRLIPIHAPTQVVQYY